VAENPPTAAGFAFGLGDAEQTGEMGGLPRLFLFFNYKL